MSKLPIGSRVHIWNNSSKETSTHIVFKGIVTGYVEHDRCTVCWTKQKDGSVRENIWFFESLRSRSDIEVYPMCITLDEGMFVI